MTGCPASGLRELVAAGMLAAALAGVPLEAQDAELEVGSRAPSVTVTDLEGGAVDLARYLGKKPVLLEFWATWCEVCEELLPRLREAHAAYGKAVQFFGVNVAVNQTREQVRRYVNARHPPFQTLYDEQGASIRAFNVPATSYVVIIDRSGRVAYTGSGATQNLSRELQRVARE